MAIQEIRTIEISKVEEVIRRAREKKGGVYSLGNLDCALKGTSDCPDQSLKSPRCANCSIAENDHKLVESEVVGMGYNTILSGNIMLGSRFSTWNQDKSSVDLLHKNGGKVDISYHKG